MIDQSTSNQTVRPQLVMAIATQSLAIALVAISAALFEPRFTAFHAFAYALVLCLSGCAVYFAFHASREQRRQRLLKRRKPRERSPWGELRTNVADPYSDRLARFLDHTTSVDNTGSPISWPAGYHPVADTNSRMPFWSRVDLPTEPNAAKPVWLIRRILQRIRDAVRR